MTKTVSVENMIKKLLKESKNPLSTYELAKRIKISWSTANTYCYKLTVSGIIKGNEEKAKVGSGKKMMWSLKK